MLIRISIAARMLVALTLLTGVAYPLVVLMLGQLLFPEQAAGSLVERGGQVVGSSLVAQKTTSSRYFHPRPSASDFGAVPSAATNLAPTSAALREVVRKRRSELGEGAPADLLFASGSGLDPHISPRAALHQLERVAKARGLVAEQARELERLVRGATEGPQLGVLGQPRVNVLRLNLALDASFP